MAVNVIMLGPPGAGKGMQAERFAGSRGIPKISTGDILREAVQAGTELGLRVKAIMASGELVGDDLVVGIVRERLARPDVAAGFVLDGFPRTVAQAIALDRIMAGRDPLLVVDLVVPEAELVRRLGTRMICADCGTTAHGVSTGAAGSPRCAECGGRLTQRLDDAGGVVLQRLKVYERDTKPLLDYYRARPTFRAIDGAQAPDRVAADLAAAVETLGSGVGARGGAGL